MEKGEFSDEIFDLKPIIPEMIYSNSSIKPQIYDNRRKLENSLRNNNPSNNPVPKLISFENSNSEVAENLATDYSLNSDIINFSNCDMDDSSSNDEYYADSSKGVSSSTTRTPAQALDHVMAERKRRENLSQLFISLSKAVPGLKKLDKASLLEDGINYLKTLQERVRVLEEEDRRSSVDAAAREDSSSYNGESDVPEIRARISDKHVLIKIFCKKQTGLMSRIPSEIMDKMHLNVVDMRIMPFGGTFLHITILAEMMQGEFEVSVKDLLHHLHIIFLNPKHFENS